MARFGRTVDAAREDDTKETDLLIDATEEDERPYSQASPELQVDTNDSSQSRPPTSPLGQRRVSSFAKRAPDGAPRTPNRVRFDFDGNDAPLASPPPPTPPRVPIVLGWRDSEENEGDEDANQHAAARGGDTQRIPLLTDIEAPSVTVALGEDEDFNPEDLLETSRPKSNMRSAFMNMANSIM
jgi:sodium-coupled neutral amino acid transporter 11